VHTKPNILIHDFKVFMVKKNGIGTYCIHLDKCQPVHDKENSNMRKLKLFEFKFVTMENNHKS